MMKSQSCDKGKFIPIIMCINGKQSFELKDSSFNSFHPNTDVR